jgi:hypothetical protein
MYPLTSSSGVGGSHWTVTSAARDEINIAAHAIVVRRQARLFIESGENDQKFLATFGGVTIGCGQPCFLPLGRPYYIPDDSIRGKLEDPEIAIKTG